MTKFKIVLFILPRFVFSNSAIIKYIMDATDKAGVIHMRRNLS